MNTMAPDADLNDYDMNYDVTDNIKASERFVAELSYQVLQVKNGKMKNHEAISAFTYPRKNDANDCLLQDVTHVTKFRCGHVIDTEKQ